MADYEMAICVTDEADLPSGHKRMKEGDTITVRLKYHPWGLKEIDQFLIVPFSSDETFWKLYEKFRGQRGADGSKRRFKINLADIKNNYLPELDLTKVRNKTIKYQPFLQASKVVETHVGLQAKDVDCGIDAEVYKTTALDPLDLIYDKDDSKYIAPKDTITLLGDV